MKPPEELCVKTPPDFSGAKAQPFSVQFQLVTEAVGIGAYQSKFDVLADAEGKVRKGAQFLPGQRLGLILTILALDSPVPAVIRFCNEVNALVWFREVQQMPDFWGHFFEQPYILELCSVGGV